MLKFNSLILKQCSLVFHYLLIFVNDIPPSTNSLRIPSKNENFNYDILAGSQCCYLPKLKVKSVFL